MTIQPNAYVTLAYTLRDAKGDVLDASDLEDGEPIEYVHGYGMIVPGLESALEGLKVGDRKDVRVSAEAGFGLRDEELVLDIDRSELPDPSRVRRRMAIRGPAAAVDLDGDGRLEIITAALMDVGTPGQVPTSFRLIAFDGATLGSPVMTITGTSGAVSRSRRSSSSPHKPGRMMSVTTTSKVCASSRPNAVSVSSATSTS